MAVAVAVQDHICRPGLCPRCQVSYQRDEVELLLTAYFNEGVLDREESVEPGMPKAASNPARQGTVMASMIDIERGLARSGLTNTARAAIYLHYGRGWTKKDSAEFLGKAPSTISEAIDRGVSVITAWLNGKTYEEQREEEQ